MVEGTIARLTMAYVYIDECPQMTYGCFIPREDVPRLLQDKYGFPEVSRGSSLYAPPQHSDSLTIAVVSHRQFELFEQTLPDVLVQAALRSDTAAHFGDSTWSAYLSGTIETGDPFGRSDGIPPPYFRF